MKPLIACLGLFQATGGPVKTIPLFREALGADLFSFANCRQLAGEPLAVPEAQAVASVDFPVARQFCLPRAASLRSLESVVREASILSVHSFYRYHCLWARKASARLGVPYWHVPHGILDPYVMSYGNVAKRLFLMAGGRSFLENASCTIFATRREWEKADSAFGRLNGEVVHWPVELQDIAEKEVRRAKIRRRLGIPGDSRVLLFFGRVQEMKRPLETIDAASSVKSDKLHLLMVGPCEGIKPVDLARRAKEQRLANFHYIGGVYGSEKYDYMFASDAYVSFSIRENFNHAAAESMASGLAVILSVGNDLGPEVADAKAGWYLHEDGKVAFRASLEEFMSTPDEELRICGERGREFVKEVLSFEIFKTRLRELEKRYGRAT